MSEHYTNRRRSIINGSMTKESSAKNLWVGHSRGYSKDYFKNHDSLPLHLAQTLAGLFESLGVKRILDVGCGTGRLVTFLNQAGFTTRGCDQAPAAIKISGQVRASVEKLPFGKSCFDALTAISLIEHLNADQTRQFLQESFRILKPKGYLFLATPNILSPLRFLVREKWFAYQDPTHIQFYSPASLKNLLGQFGFSNFRFRFAVDFSTPADWSFPLPSSPQLLLYLINLFLINSPAAYFRDSFWVLCQKRD